MADLENLLLEAAGRKGTSGRRPAQRSQTKKRREGSSSDEDDRSDKSDDSDDDRGGFASWKHSGSQVPLKKRLEKDDDHGSSQGEDDRGGGFDDDSDSASIGSDLYKDEADRDALAKMSELDRERILYERASKRDDNKLKQKVRASTSVQQNEKKSSQYSSRRPSPPPMHARGRSTRASAKDVALNELRAKKRKQEDPQAQRDRMKNVIGSGRDSSPPRRKPASPKSDSGESENESDRKGDVYSDNGDMADSDDDIKDRLAYEDVRKITIKRSKLAKWCMEPFFEDLIVGCFVRIGIGKSRNNASIYRLCLVRNVDASDPDRQYKLENRITHKYLNCVWGSESSAARWQMARVSDSPPTPLEFDDWVREVEKNGGRMLTANEVADKKEAIDKIMNSFVYSAATVKQMLQEKKSASSRPLNVAAEKDRLRREMEVAESRNDENEVERIRARLKELEASRQSKEFDAKAMRLAEMNRKNRVENFKNASAMKPVKAGLRAGEAGYDPFSRRWTRSRNYYMKTAEVESQPTVADANAEATAIPENGTGTGPGGEAATVAALEAAADAGKLVDTSAPVDLGTESNSLHNFELPISLAGLQKFGGSKGVHLALMARKQRIEATMGVRVPENDGRRHALTLTVSDYKRRMGLL